MTEYRILEIIQTIFKCPSTLEEARFDPNFFTRDRKMTFSDILFFMLDMDKSSMQNRLDNYFHRNNINTNMSQQAMSEARSKFDHSPFEKVFRAIVHEIYKDTRTLKHFHGYLPIAVDGVHFKLPRRHDLQEIYGVSGQDYNVAATASVFFDPLNCYTIDAVITKAHPNERKEFLDNLDYLLDNYSELMAKSVFLADCGYQSREVFKRLIGHDIKFVIRCGANAASEIVNASSNDSVIEIGDNTMLRVIKFENKYGEVITLATNLLDIPNNEFPELYALRWTIESSFNILKNTIGLEKFSGKTPNSILQDFWISMVLMNITTIFKNIADKNIENKHKNSNNKNKYKVCIAKLVTTLKNNYTFAGLRKYAIQIILEMPRIIALITRATVAIVKDSKLHPPREKRTVAKIFRLNLKSCL